MTLHDAKIGATREVANIYHYCSDGKLEGTAVLLSTDCHTDWHVCTETTLFEDGHQPPACSTIDRLNGMNRDHAAVFGGSSPLL